MLLSLASNKGNIIVMVLLRAVSMIISFLYVPLLLNTLESDAYAIWITLTSIISWIVMFDVGIGNGLRNKLSEAVAQNNIREAQSYVSTAYFSILIIGIALLLFIFLSINWIDWSQVLNAKEYSKGKIDLLVIIVCSGFILNFILGLINSVLLALKLPALSSLTGCIGQLISYLLVLMSVKVFKQYDLLDLCSLISYIPVVVLLVFTIFFFRGKYRFLSPSLDGFDKNKFKSIFSIGLNFFWLQIVTIILFQVNNFIIIHTAGPLAVVKYNIAYKYFYIIVTIYILICTPFWSGSTHAFIRGNLKWIKNTNNKLIGIGCVFIGIGILMLFFAKTIYKVWIGDSCPPIPTMTNILMLLYCIFMILYAGNGYIINGIGKLRLQSIITTILAIIYLPMAIYGGKVYGLNGILLALVFNAFINSIWSFLQLRRLVNNTAYGIWYK